jgi:hypothetical protein
MSSKTSDQPDRMSCCHGSTAENFAGEYNERLSEFLGTYRSLSKNPKIGARGLRSTLDIFQIKYPGLLSEAFAQFIFASAVELWLNDEALSAREAFTAGLGLLDDLESKSMLGRSFLGSFTFRSRKLDCDKIFTDAGFIIAIDKYLPCSCFAELVEEAKQHDVTAICEGCYVPFSVNDLRKCSACQCVRYCSKKCQKSDW